jgi:hypothetical protein
MLMNGRVVLLTLVAACAAAPQPTARMEASAAAIRAAEEVGAPRIPQAALHLQLAREQAQHAKMLIDGGEPEKAEGLLIRAEADADLAVALSRENATRLAAESAAEQVKALRKASLSERSKP